VGMLHIIQADWSYLCDYIGPFLDQISTKIFRDGRDRVESAHTMGCDVAKNTFLIDPTGLHKCGKSHRCGTKNPDFSSRACFKWFVRHKSYKDSSDRGSTF
jgi:hypothetical protein